MFKRRGLIPQSSSVAGDKQTVLKLPRRIDDAFAFYCGGLSSCFEQRGKLRSDGRPSFVTKVFVLGGLFELERRVPYAQCVAFIVRCFFGARHSCRESRRNIMSSASRLSPSLGARVDVVWKDMELFAVRSWRARTRGASAGYFTITTDFREAQLHGCQ